MSDDLIPHDRAHFIIHRLPLLGEAIHEATLRFQAPRRMVEIAAFGAISTVGQYLVDVKTPHQVVGPVSLATLTIAGSGERKSAVQRCFFETIRRNDDIVEDLFAEDLNEYEANLSEWKSKQRKLERAIRSGHASAKNELEGHIAARPVRPRKLILIYEDVTPMAMLSGIHETGVGGLVTSEGSVMTEGRTYDSVPHMNALHSGDSVTITRVNKPSLRIKNARLTMSVMIQPVFFEGATGKKWEKIYGSGHWSRFLICYDKSTMGQRFSNGRSHATDHIAKYNKRMIELIDQLHAAWKQPSFQRKVLEFTPEAADLWVKTADEIEGQLSPGGFYEQVQDHGSKLAEMIARLAALLHLFEGFDGGISVDTLRVAMEVCRDCSHDYVKIFSKPPQEESDAYVLNQFFDKYRSMGQWHLPKNTARQISPNSLRKDRRFYIALEKLRLDGQLSIYLCPNTRKEMIWLAPAAAHV